MTSTARPYRCLVSWHSLDGDRRWPNEASAARHRIVLDILAETTEDAADLALKYVRRVYSVLNPRIAVLPAPTTERPDHNG